MKPILVALLLFAGFTACNNNKADEHAHNSDGSHPEEGGLQNISHTIYSAKSELFVEFRPLVAGSTSRFAAHLTKLGEQFLPYTEGEVTVS